VKVRLIEQRAASALDRKLQRRCAESNVSFAISIVQSCHFAIGQFRPLEYAAQNDGARRPMPEPARAVVSLSGTSRGEGIYLVTFVGTDTTPSATWRAKPIDNSRTGFDA
jgi:hypothetical protein